MIRAVLFDIDGVLLDSLKANAEFFRELLSHFGYRGPTDDEQAMYFHLSMRDVIRKYAPDVSEAKVKEIAKYGDTIDRGFDLLEMPMESPAVLEALSKQYKLGLVSNRTRAGIEEYHKFANLRHFFQVSACYEDTVKHKPEPDPLWFAAKQLGAQPDETVYVGDAATDIAAARAAGMRMVLYAAKPMPGADATTGRFHELPGVIAALDHQ